MNAGEKNIVAAELRRAGAEYGELELGSTALSAIAGDILSVLMCDDGMKAREVFEKLADLIEEA